MKAKIPARRTNPRPARGAALLVRAASFAAHKHRDQRRKDQQASPYINHPIAVAETLCEVGRIDEDAVLAAALLHDTLEDTQTTPAELRRHFGPKVTSIVQEVTDDKRLPKAKRKALQIEHAAHLSREARLVKLADKICNVADVLKNPPQDWSLERRREYFDWAEAVIDEMRGSNARLERRFDALYRRRP